MKRPKLEATLLLCAALAVPGRARAAGPDPAADAQALIAKLDLPATQKLVADPLGKAKAAQKRAQSARGAGDLKHAAELDTLALVWAQVAADLVRATESERQLGDLQKQSLDLEQKAVRTQALIEQTIARRARAEQNLTSVEPGARSTTPASSAKPAHEAPAATSKPPTPKPEAAPAKPAPAAAKPASLPEKKTGTKK